MVASAPVVFNVGFASRCVANPQVDDGLHRHRHRVQRQYLEGGWMRDPARLSSVTPTSSVSRSGEWIKDPG